MIGERAFIEALPPSQRAVFAPLAQGHAVRISKLYSGLHLNGAATPLRRQQQYIGSFISRINRKLAPYGHRIMPGEKRGTYRMCRTTVTPAP